MSATNPGAPDTWPAKHFHVLPELGPAPSHIRAIHIPKDDRLTQEEQAALDRTFANQPTLQRRLAKGEWVMAEPGGRF
jgi:hypothetical protein